MQSEGPHYNSPGKEDSLVCISIHGVSKGSQHEINIKDKRENPWLSQENRANILQTYIYMECGLITGNFML